MHSIMASAKMEPKALAEPYAWKTRAHGPVPAMIWPIALVGERWSAICQSQVIG